MFDSKNTDFMVFFCDIKCNGNPSFAYKLHVCVCVVNRFMSPLPTRKKIPPPLHKYKICSCYYIVVTAAVDVVVVVVG